MGHLVPEVVSELFFNSDTYGYKHKTNSFFNVPGLFVGSSPKGESDSARSPTSPLDLRVFSNLGNPFRSSRSSSHEGHQKSWDHMKVGLSIVDSLDDDPKPSGKVLRSLDSKSILFGPHMHIKTPISHRHIDSFASPKSLPKDVAIFPNACAKSSDSKDDNSDVLFGIGEAPPKAESFEKFMSCSLDSSRSRTKSDVLAKYQMNSSSGNCGRETKRKLMNSPLGSVGQNSTCDCSSNKLLTSLPISTLPCNGIIGTLSASEIELSEDYTCVRTHGPNPKTTHIFCDCILECHNNEYTISPRNEEKKILSLPVSPFSNVSSLYPSNDFLSVCFCCKKKLDGKDIFMYRGETAFCSWSCRSEVIEMDEANEKVEAANKKSNQDSSETNVVFDSHEEVFEIGLFIAT